MEHIKRICFDGSKQRNTSKLHLQDYRRTNDKEIMSTLYSRIEEYKQNRKMWGSRNMIYVKTHSTLYTRLF